MELEEAIRIYKDLKDNAWIVESINKDFFLKFAETVLQALKNSIPKKKIEKLIENETIDISGFECISVEDLQELGEGK